MRSAWPGRAAALLAALYLAFLWLDGVGSDLPQQLLPLPARFFVQVSQLFPHAAREVIEWRVKGYRCRTGRFEELDVRPYFPIHADDKENRFDRAMFFYFKERVVMQALDRYIAAEERRRGDPIGGVMLMSLRHPIPAPGSGEARYRRVPVDDMPPTVVRKYWYGTSLADRERRCTEGAP